MRNKGTLIKICCLVVIVLCFVFINIYITNRNKQIAGDFNGTDEFLQTIDCSPIFDENHDSTRFVVSFDLRTDISGSVKVYIYDKNGFKYWFSPQKIDSSTEFKHYEIECAPELVDENIVSSLLSFHGSYGTGIIPHVRNVSIAPCN